MTVFFNIAPATPAHAIMMIHTVTDALFQKVLLRIYVYIVCAYICTHVCIYKFIWIYMYVYNTIQLNTYIRL